MRPTHPRSWMAVLTAAVVLVGGAALPAAAKGKPAPSTAKTYVAMGDSYASGNGTFNDDLDVTCYRSSDAYAPLVTKQLRRTTLTFVACSGATTADVVASQVPALGDATTYVTLSVGGNDIGFTDLISACVTGSDSVCSSAVATAESAIANVLPGKLADTYAAVKAKAPNARVVVVGYPRGFDPAHVGCLEAFGISSTEAGWLNGVADDIDGVIRTAATSAAFRYVDPNQTFAGHDVCASTPYLNGAVPALFGDPRDAFHPTKAGHASGFEPLVYSALTAR